MRNICKDLYNCRQVRTRLSLTERVMPRGVLLQIFVHGFWRDRLFRHLILIFNVRCFTTKRSTNPWRPSYRMFIHRKGSPDFRDDFVFESTCILTVSHFRLSCKYSSVQIECNSWTEAHILPRIYS